MHTHAYKHVRRYVCTHVHRHVYRHVHRHVCGHGYTRVYSCVRRHVYRRMCGCVCRAVLLPTLQRPAALPDNCSVLLQPIFHTIGWHWFPRTKGATDSAPRTRPKETPAKKLAKAAKKAKTRPPTHMYSCYRSCHRTQVLLCPLLQTDVLRQTVLLILQHRLVPVQLQDLPLPQPLLQRHPSPSFSHLHSSHSISTQPCRSPHHQCRSHPYQ